MYAYRVTYEGLWLGGKAIVIAANEEDAIELVRQHKNTVRFNKVNAEVITSFPTDVIVLDNSNGDY